MARHADNKDLQAYLVSKLKSWQPPAPTVQSRAKGHVVLSWTSEPFAFLADRLLYVVEKNNKIPKWIVVYSGGKTEKMIDNLAPRHPHKFRLKVIVKPEAVSSLAELAMQHHGDELTVCEELEFYHDDNKDKSLQTDSLNENTEPSEEAKENKATDADNAAVVAVVKKIRKKINVKDLYDAMKIVGGLKLNLDGAGEKGEKKEVEVGRWLESQWSEEIWTNTEPDGTSATCFCMAVKCGYLKQLQTMLDERPDLIGIVNERNGLTPLATAVTKGDITIVRFLVGAGAELEQRCGAGQTPLLLAVLAGDLAVVELLVREGADLTARDWNGLRMEHYAVDSSSLETLHYILDRGDVHVRDGNGWTPLFRAICQGARTEIIQELVRRGSDIEAVDNAGLPLTSAAKLLKNRHGRGRDSILRLVDSNYPHDKALAHFTRLTKKIYHVHSLLKLN